jgi:hypothetical protein
MISTTMQRIGIAAVTELNNFVVNTAVNKVSTNLGTVLTLFDSALSQLSWFSPNEGVLIKSVFFRMPYQFTLADCGLDFFFQANISPSTVVSFPELSEAAGAGVGLTIENNEMELGVFVRPPAAAIAGNLKWQLLGGLSSSSALMPTSVSMLNTPAALNGLTLPIIFGAKIIHGIPLTATA